MQEQFSKYAEHIVISTIKFKNSLMEIAGNVIDKIIVKPIALGVTLLTIVALTSCVRLQEEKWNISYKVNDNPNLSPVTQVMSATRPACGYVGIFNYIGPVQNNSWNEKTQTWEPMAIQDSDIVRLQLRNNERNDELFHALNLPGAIVGTENMTNTNLVHGFNGYKMIGVTRGEPGNKFLNPDLVWVVNPIGTNSYLGMTVFDAPGRKHRSIENPDRLNSDPEGVLFTPADLIGLVCVRALYNKDGLLNYSFIVEQVFIRSDKAPEKLTKSPFSTKMKSDPQFTGSNVIVIDQMEN